MDISNICVIGLGSLGSTLCMCLCDLEELKHLSIIDFDIVEKKNIKKSIYTNNDINKLKTDALYDKLINIKNDYLQIYKFPFKYDENKTNINSNLIIDCRDEIIDRNDKIDIRLYVSSRYIIIDCRKNIKYDETRQGKYISHINKSDLKSGCASFVYLLQNGFIKYLINNQMVYNLELDYLDRISSKLKNENQNNKIPFYGYEESNKFLNLKQNINKIIEKNKKRDAIICIGDKNNPITTTKILKNNIQNINDIIPIMTSLINSKSINYFYYVINVIEYNNRLYVELLPETGAA